MTHTVTRSLGAGRPATHEIDGTISLSDVLGIVWRRKTPIFLVAIATALIVGYYTTMIAHPTFSADTRLLMQAQEQKIVDVESVFSGVSTEESAINTEVYILTSRGLLETLVRDLKLTEDPEFNTYLTSPPLLSMAGIRALILGSAKTQAEDELIATVNNVRRTIQVSALRKTYLLDIVVTTRSPVKSQLIANRLAQLYLDRQIAVKYEATEEAINWLSGRVSDLEQDLLQRSAALDNLRQTTTLVSSEALAALSIQAKDLRSRLQQAEAQETERRASLAALEAAVASGAPEAILEITDDMVLDRLYGELADGGAQARFRFDQRVDMLVQSEQQALERQLSQSELLRNSLENLMAEISAQSDDQTALNQLEREVEATRVLYETFLSRLKEASVQIGLQQPDSRVLSVATPGSKASPRRTRSVAVALVLGGILGAIVVVIQHIYYSGVRDSEELEKVTGHAVLGSVPKVDINDRSDLLPFLRNNPTSPAAEAIRNIRTSLLMADFDNPPKVICSTSSLPGEGKTTHSISLAISLADMGKRVLLIDGDLRRQTLREYLDFKASGTLVSLLSGESALADSTDAGPVPNLDIMMSGPFHANAMNMFDSVGFRQLLAELRNSYDHIVIDTPPVLLVPDARVIGTMSDAVIYSVLWNSTPREQVIEGIRMLERTQCRICGLILARVDGKKMRYYGYANGYGSQYDKYSNTSEGYFNVSGKK